MRAQVLYPTLTAYGHHYCAPRRLVSLTYASLQRHGAAPFLNLSLFTAFRSPFSSMEQFHSRTGSTGKKSMVESLKRFGVISSKRVAEVMEALDRGLFVPAGSSAYADTPLPIGYNATISAPHMHATCLQLLEDKLQPGMRALDVGSGTGYLTGCFALMVGAEGSVVGVEHIPGLVDMSIKNIEKSVAGSLLKKGALSLHVGDGRKGWNEFAPYDAIHVGAAASEVPQALLDQLKPGGRMVIPVGTYFQELKVIDKNEDGSIKVHTETSVRYVPLTSRDEQTGGF
ncbi:hypothetical protein EUTSA_v10014311mg [Eutrema salsugineum]|uniref:Protein-L-isoaspartate O-methyltransferase n=1 Tax=Eutrema salsugineum TaxID=72664 RepID=V4LUQ4_EUTSA|nr:protein-L-isoaspartate O-methyltransferase 2 isoform X2 [Eutrema salsugineum]ESQ43608.1 hypothetical protein EUTSA_v10014311mg [Eutrema salsugineum]